MLTRGTPALLHKVFEGDGCRLPDLLPQARLHRNAQQIHQLAFCMLKLHRSHLMLI